MAVIPGIHQSRRTHRPVVWSRQSSLPYPNMWLCAFPLRGQWQLDAATNTIPRQICVITQTDREPISSILSRSMYQSGCTKAARYAPFFVKLDWVIDKPIAITAGYGCTVNSNWYGDVEGFTGELSYRSSDRCSIII